MTVAVNKEMAMIGNDYEWLKSSADVAQVTQGYEMDRLQREIDLQKELKLNAVNELKEYETEYHKLETDYYESQSENKRLQSELDKLQDVEQMNVWLMKRYIVLQEQINYREGEIT